MSHETARWILSALVQAFAALMALVGLFAVFKLQLIRGELAKVRDEFAALWAQTMHRVSDHFGGHLPAAATRRNIKPFDVDLGASWANYDRQVKPLLDILAEEQGSPISAWVRKTGTLFGALRQFEQLLETDYKLCKVWTFRVTATSGFIVSLSLALLVLLDAIPPSWRTLTVATTSVLAILAIVANVLVIKAILVERVPSGIPKT